MQNKDVIELLKKYNDGKCTDEEKGLLESWYLRHEADRPLDFPQEARDRQLDEIWASLPVHENEKQTFQLWPKLAAACVLLVVCSTGLYFYHSSKKDDVKTPGQSALSSIIKPGGTKAVLTLANGKKIVLDDASRAEIAKESGLKITKSADGKLVYVIPKSNSEKVTFNTIETPRGGQYQIVLPDGSQVWLNAASSIRYPTSFAADSRTVTITGEVYFEVAKNPLLPFKVISQAQTVEVLGTHFNISAYQDDPLIKTTLMEGSVKVTNDKYRSTATLHPGQQSLITTASKTIAVKPADTEDILAWKNGAFNFNNEDLSSIMNKLSRWYDIDISYTNQEIRKQRFSGSIPRSADITEVLHFLEYTGTIHFKVSERRIYVMP
jgi:ferric-dicitrate binding protein FerR (iron transport regulator)